MMAWLLALLLGPWLAAAAPEPAGAPASAAASRPPPTGSADLDRIAFAVEGAESSYGRDRRMWQPEARGPQGPMQVTQAAALDVGGGNRFDAMENRLIGRAYLAAMLRRYGNWPDAVAAYNWGPGNLDRWIAAGRPAGGLVAPIQAYIERIMHEAAGEVVGGNGSVVAAPAARLSILRAVEPPPPEIRDPRLKKAFGRNAAAIKQLRGFLGGDAAEAGAVLTTMRSLSGRPGYEHFKMLRPVNPAAAANAGLREIAGVMLDKLRSENAAIALVDERRHGGSRLGR